MYAIILFIPTTSSEKRLYISTAENLKPNQATQIQSSTLPLKTQVSRLITMNYAFTKSICIPAGTGSGMVIPVSSLCCWKTGGLWCLFLLFLPSLLFKALLALESPTPSSERGAQERLTTPLRSSRREALKSESVIRWRDKGVRWC